MNDEPTEAAQSPIASSRPQTDDAAESPAAPQPKRTARGTSKLGLLAVFLGIAACLFCRPSLLPPAVRSSPNLASWVTPTPPAVAGMTLAFLALLAMLAGSRAKPGLPLLAVLLCLAALSVSAYQAGARDVNTTRRWADGEIETYRAKLSELKNKIAPPVAHDPAGGTKPANSEPNRGPVDSQSAQTPSVISQPGAGDHAGSVGGTSSPHTGGDQGIGAGTIFDMRPGSPGSSPGSNGTPVPVSPGGVPGAPAVSPAPLPALSGAGSPSGGGVAPPPVGSTITPLVLSARAALQAAQGKVTGVEDNFRFAYAKTNDPQYVAAQAEVDAADKLVEDAKRRSDGFGQPLIDATRQRKEAQEKVARIVNDAMAHDPAVTASRAELAAAEKSLREAYDAAPRSK